MKVPGSQADWIAPVANTRLVTRDRLLHLLSRGFAQIVPACWWRNAHPQITRTADLRLHRKNFAVEI